MKSSKSSRRKVQIGGRQKILYIKLTSNSRSGETKTDFRL